MWAGEQAWGETGNWRATLATMCAAAAAAAEVGPHVHVQQPCMQRQQQQQRQQGNPKGHFARQAYSP
jgi:hypothetical protein